MRWVGSLRRHLIKVLSVFFGLLLVLGCVCVLTGKNYFAFVFSLALPTLVIFNLVGVIYLGFKKSKFVFLPVIGLILFFSFFDSFFQFNEVPVKNEFSENLSVLTYNVHGFDSKEKENGIVSFIEQFNPDIILFQEFSAIKFKLFVKDYPYWTKTNLLAPNKSVLAIFSKYPIVSNSIFQFPNSKNNGMYVDIQYKNETIRVYNLHLESFGLRLNSSLYSEKGVSTFLSRVSQAQMRRIEQVNLVKNSIDGFNGKILICGDFNSTQFSSTYLEFEKDKKDSFIEKGNGLGTTYNLKGYPLRLDYILVDKEIKILSHKNFKLGFSDHEPILVDLNIK